MNNSYDDYLLVVNRNVNNGVFSKYAADNYETYPLKHELGHVVYANLSPKQKKKVADLFAEVQKNGTMVSKIAAQNPNEFFAEYVSLFTDGELLLKLPEEDPVQNAVVEKIFEIVRE